MLALYLSDVTGTKAQWETAVAAHRLDAQPYMAGTAGRSGCHERAPTKTILPPGASRVVDAGSWRHFGALRRGGREPLGAHRSGSWPLALSVDC